MYFKTPRLSDELASLIFSRPVWAQAQFVAVHSGPDCCNWDQALRIIPETGVPIPTDPLYHSSPSSSRADDSTIPRCAGSSAGHSHRQEVRHTPTPRSIAQEQQSKASHVLWAWLIFMFETKDKTLIFFNSPGK